MWLIMKFFAFIIVSIHSLNIFLNSWMRNNARSNGRIFSTWLGGKSAMELSEWR